MICVDVKKKIDKDNEKNIETPKKNNNAQLIILIIVIPFVCFIVGYVAFRITMYFLKRHDQRNTMKIRPRNYYTIGGMAKHLYKVATEPKIDNEDDDNDLDIVPLK